jgi:hypothetical protein
MGPAFLLEALGKRASDRYRWINLPTHEGLGLGVIQKIGDGAASNIVPSFFDLLRQRWFHKIDRRGR